MNSLVPALGLLFLLAACGDPDDAPTSEEVARGSEDTPARLDPAALRAAVERAGIDARDMGVWRRTTELVLYAVPVKAKDAIDHWTRARQHVDAWGYYPVVVDDTDREFQGHLRDDEPKPLPTLERAADLDPVTWTRARIQEDEEYYGKAQLGTWSPGEPQQGFTVPHDHEGKPRPGLRLVFVPTTKPWEAIGWFQFGGWNACPEPEVHVAVQRRWHERHGAELVCLTRDVIEMRVQRPVTEKDEALDLAREQFVYSGGDLVYQGFDSLRNLATSLIGARSWYFWWD